MSLSFNPFTGSFDTVQLIAGLVHKSGIPSSKTSTGIPGQVCVDGVNGIIYICVQPNNWRQIVLDATTFTNLSGFP